MSFFADLLGNAALSGAKIAGDLSEQEQALARQENASRLDLERAKAVEVLREERAKAAEIAKRERLTSQMASVEQQAPTITRARELASAQGRAPSVDGNVLDVIKSRLSPEQVEKFYGVDNSPVAKMDDKLSVARKGGMYEAEDMLSAARKETVASMKAALDERKAAAKEAMDAARFEQTERKNDNQFNAQMAAISARSAKGEGGKAANAVEKLTTMKGLELREIEAIASRVSKRDLPTNPEYIAAQDRLKQINKMLATRWEKDVDGEPAAPTPAPGKPAPAPAKPSSGYADGTLLKGPGGKTYIVKNGVPVPQ